jgi:hypothetical protein
MAAKAKVRIKRNIISLPLFDDRLFAKNRVVPAM